MVDFAKFFMMAIFLDIFLFAGGYMFYAEMGESADNPFAEINDDLNILLDEEGNINSTTFEGMNPEGGSSSDEVTNTNIIFVISGGLSSFWNQILAGLKILWVILTSPIQIANILYEEISHSGGTNFGLKLLFNGMALVWMIGQSIGLLQFLRGAKL